MATQKPPTIYDIAEEAGLSKSVVSRALQGQKNVSENSRRRVLETAERLGYVPNAMARGLAANRTRTLGVVLRDVRLQYYGLLQSALQQRAMELGYNLVTVTGVKELTATDALSSLRSLIALRVDGLIISSAQLSGEDMTRYINQVPVVVAGHAEYGAGLVSVHCDEEDGGRQMAEYLIKLGHRKVAVLLVSDLQSASQYARGMAMINTLHKAHVAVVEIDLTQYRGPIGPILEPMLSDPDITALMCPNDLIMMEVMEDLRIRNIPVPDRLSVTGYDGFGCLAEPLLGFTSFRQPVEKIGAVAVDRLIEWVETGVPKQERTPIMGTLIPGRTASFPHNR